MRDRTPWLVALYGAQYVVVAGDLHFGCCGCGERWRIALPAPVDIVSRASRAYVAYHRRCGKTWREKGKPTGYEVFGPGEPIRAVVP